MLSGLLTLLYIPSIVQVLKNTGQSSDPESAFKRYLKTINHVILWYDDQERIKSLRNVRKVHKSVSRSQNMSQFDMVITQWGFIGPVLIKSKELGMSPISDQDLDGLRYVIFCVGKCIGINDELNLCQNSLQDAQEYSKIILEEIIQPHLKTETALSKEMADNLLQGIHFLNPFLTPMTFKAWAFEVFQVSCQNGAKNSFSYLIMEKVFKSGLRGTQGRILRPIFNLLGRVNIYLANRWQHHIMIPSLRPIL